MQIPNTSHVIIIGAMKAGTTSLYDYFLDHKDICSCVVKEPEFFSETMNHGVKSVNYQELWPDYNGEKYVLESSTGYTRFPREKGVAKRMYDSGIKPKFIYLVRDPVKRIESHQNFMSRYIEYNMPATHSDVLETSNYYLQLKQFLKYFPKGDLLVLDFDDLKTKPQSVVNKITDFLDIAEHEISNTIHNNETLYPSFFEMSIKSLSLFKKSRHLIPESVAIKVKKFISKFSQSKKIALTSNEITEIKNHLKDDMKSLKKEFNINIEKWGF
jgi:hypothetical protein|tara:strand:- start:16817 stop:17629 length:813 start_codon:yes stop_codon:yes gene_type:complete